MRQINVPGYFQRYAWANEQLEENLWRSSFTVAKDLVAQELDFDLYVMLGADMLHFAVSPFVVQPEPACRLRLYEGLLRLNQQMERVYFALDEEGDVNLLGALPRRACSYARFAATMDSLVGYTELLAHDATRLAKEPHFHSPMIPTTL